MRPKENSTEPDPWDKVGTESSLWKGECEGMNRGEGRFLIDPITVLRKVSAILSVNYSAGPSSRFECQMKD